ncbi:MAG: DUF2911 domain-containing protein [Chthoniobacterales bacterium]
MKTSTLRLLIPTLLLCVGGASSSRAQTSLKLPDVSQQAMVQQRVELTDITVTYHRPLVNGRKIWGGLVPMNEVWRAGANENTAIDFSTPVMVEGKPLPAGRYGLHMIPGADTWTVIFSKMAVAWGSYSYNESEDALRVTVKPREIPMEEALEYEFEDLKADSVTVTMKWDKLAVPFSVAAKVEDSVLPSIRNEIRGRAQYEWQKMNEAAQYCLSKKINLEEALKWTETSIGDEERFENLMTKADLLKALNKPAEAKTAEEKAMAKANDLQLYSYARSLQREKHDAEAMALYPEVVKRFPDALGGYLAQARLKSATGDFAGAAEAVKKAQSVSPSEEQKKGLQPLIDKLQAKQDINK